MRLDLLRRTTGRRVRTALLVRHGVTSLLCVTNCLGCAGHNHGDKRCPGSTLR